MKAALDIEEEALNCIRNHHFFVLVSRSLVSGLVVFVYGMNTHMNSRKMQQACTCQEMVNVILSQRDANVRCRGVSRHFTGK